MMLGGYESFGNSDWGNTRIANLLPVELNATGQIDTPVQMVPTYQGRRHYVMRLADNETDNAALWSSLPKLDGMTRLGTVKPGAIVLARSEHGGQSRSRAGRSNVLRQRPDARLCRRHDLEMVAVGRRGACACTLLAADRALVGQAR